jgi:formiminoglutamate deiminase
MLQQRFSDGSFDAWAERAAATATPAHARLGAAAHSVRAVPPAELHAMGAWCREHSTVLHAHVSEQPAENEQCLAAYGLTPVGLLAREGVLDGDFTAVHATHLTDADMALLGAFEAHIALCPTTERDLADGVGPAAALKAANAQLCVGSDSHAVIDLFEEVRAIELDERLVTLQRGRHRPLSLLEAATVNGHRSLGWSDAGRLMEGYRADFVTVRTDSVRTAGAALGSMVEMAVYAASAADVAHVVCDGNVVVSEGRHRSIDVGRELAHSISELLDVRDDQTGGSAS